MAFVNFLFRLHFWCEFMYWSTKAVFYKHTFQATQRGLGSIRLEQLQAAIILDQPKIAWAYLISHVLNMKIAINENLPFVWQEHPPVWGALPLMATFRAEEKLEHAEKLWNVLCVWYEKHVRLFSCFLEGINVIELPPSISQIWWQLSSGTVAERRVCERCGENWNLHHREEGIFLCISRRSEGLFFGFCFCQRPWQILGWAEPAGVGTESIWVCRRRCYQRKPNPFFQKDCQGYLEVGLKRAAVFPAVRNTSLWTLPGG